MFLSDMKGGGGGENVYVSKGRGGVGRPGWGEGGSRTDSLLKERAQERFKIYSKGGGKKGRVWKEGGRDDPKPGSKRIFYFDGLSQWGGGTCYIQDSLSRGGTEMKGKDIWKNAGRVFGRVIFVCVSIHKGCSEK